MEILKLSEIAKAVGSTVAIDGEINEISTDTRTISKGCLFVAIKGENFDVIILNRLLKKVLKL